MTVFHPPSFYEGVIAGIFCVVLLRRTIAALERHRRSRAPLHPIDRWRA